MIKHYYILFITLVFSGVSMAKENGINENDELFKQWDDSLNSYLLNHPHPDVQITGLSLSSPDLPLINEADAHFKLNHEQQNYVDHINRLIKQNNLSGQAIFQLLSLCSHNAIRTACDRDSLIKTFQKTYPRDLFAYFEPFSQAVRNGDLALAEYLIKDMQNTTYATDMISLPEVVKSAIHDFMQKNPLPRSVLKHQLEHFVDVDPSVSDKQLNQAFFYIKISGIQMALPIPAYKPLLDYCSSETSPTQACLQVADILITQGQDIISQLIGHRLKVNSYEHSLETDLLVQAEDKNDQFRTRYECIRGALSQNNHYVDYLDIAYAQLWFSDDKELQRIKSAARYLFDKAQKAGFSDVKDPNDCDVEIITP